MRFAIIALFLLCSPFGYAMSDFKAHISINGTKTFQVEPGKPLSVELYFTDPRTQTVYKDFKIMHGKLMHMVLIKKDLSVFKHIHPYFDPSSGRFRVTMNMPYADPDNQHAVNALVEPGMYMIMVDVEVKGVGMRMAHIMLNAVGDSQNRTVDLDPIDADMSVTKFFYRNVGDEKPTYKARLAYETTSGCMANLNEFTLELYELDETNNYVPLKNLQPWLEQAGHAVWVSETLMSNHKTHYAHMHAEMKSSDSTEEPDQQSVLTFTYFDKSTLLPGKQKVWIQFKHNNQVMTLPFVFEYYPSPVTGDNC